jgi:hypothetical protein
MDELPNSQRRISGIAARTPRWRLTVYDNMPRLYDMLADPRQRNDVSQRHPQILTNLQTAVKRWYADVTEHQPARVPIPIGYEVEPAVLLSAPDAHLHGRISVKGKSPSDIYWIHTWTSTEDYVGWDLDVVKSGSYDVSVTYVNPHGRLPVQARLKRNDLEIDLELSASPRSKATKKASRDRVTKDVTTVLNSVTQGVGIAYLNKGRDRLCFRVRSVPGPEFKLRNILLKRIEEATPKLYTI